MSEENYMRAVEICYYYYFKTKNLDQLSAVYISAKSNFQSDLGVKEFELAENIAFAF